MSYVNCVRRNKYIKKITYILYGAGRRPFAIGLESVDISLKQEVYSLCKIYVGDEMKFLHIGVYDDDIPVLCYNEEQ